MKPQPRRPARKGMTGVIGEARLQAHLGLMEAEKKAGPYVMEVAAATRGAAKDVARRARTLRAHLAALKQAR